MSRLAGKRVLVTGAARGLGAAIAAACVSEGATVVLTDVLAEQASATAAALGRGATSLPLDVVDPLSWAAVADRVHVDLGGLDALVNNAGIVSSRSLAEESLEGFRRTLDVNLAGPFLGIKAFLGLCPAGGGSIVNLSSVRGIVGGANIGAYAASKFGIRGLTKVAAIELGPLGIRVNSVCPGTIETEMTGGAQWAGLDHERYFAQLPLGRQGRPTDVADAVVWLVSDGSGYVTGTEIVVDGGLTASGISAQPRRA